MHIYEATREFVSTGPCMQYLIPTALDVEYIFTIVIGTNFLTCMTEIQMPVYDRNCTISVLSMI